MNKTLFGVEPIKTISYSNDEIIKSIMTLYEIERFDLDCTYSKGVFWKNLPQPVHKTDLYPQRKDVVMASSDNLPFDDGSLNSIMFDPPFLIAGNGYKTDGINSSKIAKRFEAFPNYKSLKQMYAGTIRECHRVLEKDGILVVKCQDTVSGGKNHFTHCMVMDMAISAGLTPLDMFILMTKNVMNSFGGRWNKQIHARKHHSYFWVFRKTKNKVDYKF